MCIRRGSKSARAGVAQGVAETLSGRRDGRIPCESARQQPGQQGAELIAGEQLNSA